MATTQILPFATEAYNAGGNVLSPTAYAALTTLLAAGFQSGVAPSVQVNTVLRQASFMAAGLANYLVSKGITQNDDGNLSGLVTNIAAAIAAGTNVFYGGTSTGTATAQVIAATGATLTPGTRVSFIPGYSSTGNSTAAVNGTAATQIAKRKTGGFAQIGAGDLIVGMVAEIEYDGTYWILVDPVDLVQVSDFTANQNLTTSGFQKLPGGLILQYGVANASIAGNTVTFPETFPTALYGIVTGIYNNSETRLYTLQTSNTLSNFVFYDVNSTALHFWGAVGK